MLSKDLVFLDVEYKTSDEFLKSIADKLFETGYVKESFKDAIIKREEEYPTAIGTEKYNLAIPHTDSEHVNKPGIAFARLKNECEFKEMCTNNDINVNMAFVLLVTQKEEQVSLLSKLMELFGETEFLESLYNEQDPSVIVDVLNNKIL